MGTAGRAVIAAAGWVAFATAAIAQCTFSDLAWDGDHVRVRIDAAGAVRDARVDPATGAVTAIDPRVREAVWIASRGRILFRDALGVFEIAPDPGAEPHLQVFVPDGTPRFLRAFGADESGRLSAWIYDREQSTHQMWTQTGGGAATRRDAAASGPEALRWWNTHDRGVAFTRASVRAVRTTCVRYGTRAERVCVEPTGRGSDGRARFQLVVGRAGEMGEWARDVIPNGIAVDADSSAVVLGLEEGDGAEARVTTWLATPEQARRIATSAARANFDARVHWSAERMALWVDAAGALWRIDTGAASATAILPARAAAAPSPLHRVVVARTADRDSAQALVERIAAIGFEAGMRRDGSAWEVQAGASALRAEVDTRVTALRGRGYAPRVATGGAALVAPGISFGAVAHQGGRRAFVRNADTVTGAVSELWLQEGTQPPRRIVAPAAGN